MSLDLSVMVDESGSEDSRHYLVTLVFLKYQRQEQTATDEKVFGTHGRFKKLCLRMARRRLLLKRRLSLAPLDQEKSPTCLRR